MLVLNSSESHSGLDATAAREIQPVRGPPWGNSYSFWFIPSFCCAFALPGMGFYTEHIVTFSWFLAVPKGRCCLIMPTYYAPGSFSLLCKPTIFPSCLQGFYDVLRRNSQLASSIMETLLSQVKYCYVAWLQRLRILHCTRYGKQCRLHIGKIVLPYTGNMFKCCSTSLRRCSNPCYVERAD